MNSVFVLLTSSPVQPDAPTSRMLLERMGPSDVEVVYERFGAVLYGAALRICPSAENADKLLERTFVAVGSGRFRYKAAHGSPVLWLLARLRDTAKDMGYGGSTPAPVQGAISTVNGPVRSNYTLCLRCFGFSPTLEGSDGRPAAEGAGNSRFLPLRNALPR